MVGLKPFSFAPETSMISEGDYADMEVIDLSAFPFTSSGEVASPFGSGEQIVHDTIRRAFKTLRETGFISIKGHGLTPQEIHRQFDIGKMLFDEVTEEEKMSLHAKIWEGEWAGYKPRGYYKRPDGGEDTHEYCDFYPYTIRQDRLPSAARPFLEEIRAFARHNHYYILRRVLAILSLGLGLSSEALWRLHHRLDPEADNSLTSASGDCNDWVHSKDHLRYAVYHPLSESDREKKKRLWLPGHTDLGSVTFIYSQPIAGLQVLFPDGSWKYIRHYPDQILLNFGDSMEFVTGGILRAVPHRVREPPEDQRHLDRLGVFCFIPFLREILLQPLPELVDVTRADPTLQIVDAFEEHRALGGKPLTSDEWLVYRSKLLGTRRVQRETRTAEDALEDIHFRYNP